MEIRRIGSEDGVISFISDHLANHHTNTTRDLFVPSVTHGQPSPARLLLDAQPHRLAYLARRTRGEKGMSYYTERRAHELSKFFFLPCLRQPRRAT